MVSLIKNQLLKHLSRYTKNLSSEKINISTFCGEGELSNLELDEKVLTELLELPLWLRLTSAVCNHVSFRISWTKLRSVPITLCLDEVNITVETCEFTTRSDNNNQTSGGGLQSLSAPQGKYSFIHRIIDGITIKVNTVNVKFKSPAFTATVQMSRICVESKTPKWLLGDLRVTRLKDKTKGLLLIFKELSWQTVRIEASSTQDKNLTPLRLLTNQARCRITIKKKLSDCSIFASRLVLILDDLLWVLTDAQLKAALHFVDSLSSLIQASTNLTQKTKAKKKLETLPEYLAQKEQHQISSSSSSSKGHTIREDPTNHLSAIQNSFNLFDVRETSYHFFSQHIDLHLCDDPGDGRSCHPNLNDGGALQISVHGFQIDYYPFHLARSDRSHWPKYREASVPPYLWLEQSLNVYRESLLNLSQPNRPSSHPPLERYKNNVPATNNNNDADQLLHSHSSSTGGSGSNTPIDDSPAKRKVTENLAKLMTSCVILRIEDFTLFRVTTAGKKQMPKEFISGDKERYSFPPEISALHAEFTYFYFPGDNIFPLPPSKIFVHLNPIQIHFHLDSVLWFNSFILNLHKSLLETSVATAAATSTSNANGTNNNGIQQEPSIMYMDVKLEAIMPRIIFEATVDQPTQRDRPKILQIQISRFALTNIREVGSSRADLAQALHSLQEGSLVFGTSFPSKKGDMCIFTDRILSHVAASDIQSTPLSTPTATVNTSFPNTTQSSSSSTTSSSTTTTTAINLTRYALWDEPRDVWCIKLDPIWIDFLGTRSVGVNKPVPFVDAVPVTIWIHGKSYEKQVIPEKSLSSLLLSQISDHRLEQNQYVDHHNKTTTTTTTIHQPPPSSHQNLIKTDNTLVLSVANLNQTFIDKNIYLNNSSLDEIQNEKKMKKNNPFLFNDDDDDDDDVENIKFQNQFKKITPLSPTMIDSVDSGDDEDGADGFIKGKTTNEDNVNSPSPPPPPPSSADLYLIAHVSNLVSVQIDHYQFLFILRLAEEITELTTFLSLDSNRILQKQQSSNSIIFGCCIPQVEVTFVMPSQTPGKESSGGDAESVLPDSVSLGDDLHMNSNVWNSTAGAAVGAAATAAPNSSINIGIPLKSLDDQLKCNNDITILTGGQKIGMRNTTQNSSTNHSSTNHNNNNNNDDDDELLLELEPQFIGRVGAAAVAAPAPPSLSFIIKNSNSVIDSTSFTSSIKKRFSNIKTSIDNAFTSDDISDTISVQSDISSDSDKCLKNIIIDDDLTTDFVDVTFNINSNTTINENTLKVAPVEVASEVCEEQQYKTNTSSPSEPSEGSTWKRRDLVSMATFRLTTVEIIRQNRGFLSSLKLQISAVACDECGAIPWDELQTKFSARCRAWNIATYNPEEMPCIQLRLDQMLTPPPSNPPIKSIVDKKCVLDWFSHNVNVHVNDLTLDVLMSTLIGLGDLTEDEHIQNKPLPLNLLLKNVKINIMEDRPPVNITSPGPIPINVHVGKMFLKRDESGIFNIQPIINNDDHDGNGNGNENDDDQSTDKKLNKLSTSSAKRFNDQQQQQQQQQEKKKERDREILSLQLIMQQLKLDNNNLRKQLTKMEKSFEDQLNSSKSESHLLMIKLKRAQDNISELLDEKRTLLDTVRSLEVQTLDKTRNFNPNR